MPSSFSAAVERAPDVVRVRFTGELDLGTLPQAESALRRARDAGDGPLELDLSELTFVDSSGLRLVLRLDTLCRRDGCELRIVPGPRSVQRVFDLAGVLDILPFTPDAH